MRANTKLEYTQKIINNLRTFHQGFYINSIIESLISQHFPQPQNKEGILLFYSTSVATGRIPSLFCATTMHSSKFLWLCCIRKIEFDIDKEKFKKIVCRLHSKTAATILT